MKSALSLLLAAAFLLTGCCTHPQRGPGQEVTGLVLNPGVRLSTAQNMFIRAGDRAGGDYSFVFGPYLAEPKVSFDDPDMLATGGVAPSIALSKKNKQSPQQRGAANRSSSTMAVFSTTGAAVMPQPAPAGRVAEEEVEVFEVQSGMTLYWGTRPKAKSRRIYIGGDGTKFLLYVEPPVTPGEASLEHVVLVDPVNSDQARVYRLDQDGQPVGEPIVLRAGHLYVRMNLDGSFTESDTVPAQIQAVVDYAKQQANTAGVWNAH